MSRKLLHIGTLKSSRVPFDYGRATGSGTGNIVREGFRATERSTAYWTFILAAAVILAAFLYLLL